MPRNRKIRQHVDATRRSVGASSSFPSGEAATPAAHSVTADGTQTSPKRTLPGSTPRNHRRGPNFHSQLGQLVLRAVGKAFGIAGRTRGPPSTSKTRVCLGSMVLNSFARTWGVQSLPAFPPVPRPSALPPPPRSSVRWQGRRGQHPLCQLKCQKKRGGEFPWRLQFVFNPGASGSHSSCPK